jgi:RHS repeat-associated protein
MFKKALTCILFFLLGWTAVHAAIEPYEQQLRGKLRKGDTLIVKDEKFRNPVYDWNTIRNKLVTNSITFGLYSDSLMVMDKSFSCDLDLKVEYWSQPDQENPVVLEHVSLKINYDTTLGASYQAQSVYDFNNAYRIKITINDISSKELGSELPPIFTLTARVIVDRVYTTPLTPVIPFVEVITNDNEGEGGDIAARTVVTDGITQTSNEVSVIWTKQGAEVEYDLEWTYVDEESPGGIVLNNSGTGTAETVLAPMFRNNATRVTVSGHEYKISLVHNSKYLLLRIRSVTYDLNNFRVEEPWGYKVKSGGSEISAVIILNNPWHQPKLNWQYSASYAEEGKKKEVVSYFDGTLRNRQSVTFSQMTSDRYVVVQENVYDQFGRKAVSILPAPVSGEALTYFPNFNLSGTRRDSSYSYKDAYKGTSPSCFTLPDSLANSIGASKYYSPANEYISTTPFNSYIPDAQGYPFAVTTYTPDNTGRINMQGGVGPMFQPNDGVTTGNKVTRYYYGKPEQWELDRLFGNDVGYANHYLKNMVIDPNGQISVSYVNASGKTIATALAGATPSNVQQLTTKAAAKKEEMPLLEPGSFVFDSVELKMSASTTYLASVPDRDAKIIYNIDQLIKKYTENKVTICSNCYYDLKVRVYDDCNNKIYENDNYIKIGSEVSNCELTGSKVDSIMVDMPRIGTYYISFELSMNQEVIRAYTEDFITRNTNLKTQFQFILDELKRTDFTGCYNDCLTCQEALGAKDSFIVRLMEKFQTIEMKSSSYPGTLKIWADGLYDALYGKCQYLRAVCVPSPCQALEDLMKMDVSPGGQYATFDEQGRVLDSSTNVLSQYWRTVFPPLASSAPGYNANLITREDGSTISVNDTAFKLPDLVRYWRPSWAERFKNYHPEICALNFCKSNSSYLGWDERVKTLYAKDANISDIKPRLQYETNIASWLLAADLYFASGNAGAGFYTRFKSDLDNYSRQVLKNTDVRLINKGLSQYVDYQLYCSDSLGNINTSTLAVNADRWNKCVPAATCRVPDRQWELYRQLYFSLKEKYYQEARDSACKGMCQIGTPYPVIVVPPKSGLDTSANVTKCKDIQSSYFSPITVERPVDNELYICYDSVATRPVPPGMTIVVGYKFTSQGTNPVRDFVKDVILEPVSFCSVEGKMGLGYRVDNTGIGKVTDFALRGPQFRCYEPCVGSNISINDFRVTPVSGPNHYSITYLRGFEKPITVGTSVTVWVGLKMLDGTDTKKGITFVGNGPTTILFDGYRTDAEDGMPYWIINVACDVPANSCAPGYVNKLSRISTVQYDRPISSDTVKLKADAHEILDSILNTNCESMASNLMRQLATCPKLITSLAVDSSVYKSLRKQIYDVLRSGADSNHLYGTSTVPPGKTVPGPYDSIATVIKGVLSLPKFSMLCNPWILNMPYPANVKSQAVDRVISVTNKDLCAKLNTIKLAYNNAPGGLTFYKYLVKTYGDGMNISESDLAVLMKGCDNCKYLLYKDLKLPVFLDAGATGCINGTTFRNELTAFNAQWSDLDTEMSSYETIFVNYMNQRWGFSLDYGSYKDYQDLVTNNIASTELLCNVPVYSTVEKDPYECLLNLAGIAIAEGKRQYDAYIDSVKMDFRKRYVMECSRTQAKARAVMIQQLYHFTLYYYDQAGNLVRTVPPEGVDLLDASQLEQIRAIRKLKEVSCNYNGPAGTTFQGTALQQLNFALAGNNQSVEMWLNNTGSGPAQVVTATSQYLFNVCVDGNYLYGDVYTLDKETGAVNLTTSNHVVADIRGVTPLRQWTHIVLQGSSFSGDIIDVYVNGTFCPPAYNATKGSCISEINLAQGQVTAFENVASLKHLRLYKRQLTSAEIRANAQEPCLGISAANTNITSTTLRYWARFNAPTEGGGGQVPGDGPVEKQYTAVYPHHRMVTDYTYNAQNQVVKQYTPDAKGSRFWYDKAGRLFASQNNQQLLDINTYSYTKHDAQSRIIEVGQSKNTTVPSEDGSNASTFLSTGIKRQLTLTFYDVAAANSYPHENLRKRVAYSVTYEPSDPSGQQATYYSYDISGNVKTLTQVLSGLGAKQIDYKYDLVSGKVDVVRYQAGKDDKFYYGYEYDAENRLVNAKSGISASSADGWTINTPVLDAYYQYYKHGPLARTELGKNMQGVDYAYTLQGWLKGINGNYLQPANEMGQDGKAGAPTSTLAKDEMALTLDYFKDDYKPIGTNNAFPLKWVSQTTDTIGRDLFNGNISRSTLALSEIGGGTPVGYSYGYDQLNRLVHMRQHPLTVGTLTWGAASAQQAYQEDIEYDGNGNILKYLRNGQGTPAFPLAMDNLTYHYKAGNNQLLQINDAVTNNGTVLVDLKNQDNTDNYVYDGIGNLIQDKQAGISSIEWTVYGKIKRILKTNVEIVYSYDAAGNRVYKAETVGGKTNQTWYVRDAQGNTLAVYGNKDGGSNIYWQEQHLYGSSRIGMWLPDTLVGTNMAAPQWTKAGQKRYELTNHLGNVLASLNDSRRSNDPSRMTVVNMGDYAPFGMQLVGRQYSLLGGGKYRFGFNGKENDNEVKGDGNSVDFGSRIYDSRVGRWLSTDNVIKPYLSPYQYAKGSPTNFIDPDGEDEIHFVVKRIAYVDGMSTHYGPSTTTIQVIPKGGPDRFFYKQVTDVMKMKYASPTSWYQTDLGAPTVVYDRTTTSTKEFYPRGDGPNGQGGLFKSSGVTSSVFYRSDDDWTSLAKLASPSLAQYLEKKDPKSYGGLGILSAGISVGEAAQTYFAAMALMEGGVALLKGTRGAGAIDNAAAQELSFYARQADEFLDCSDIASRMYRDTKGGNVLEIRPKSGRWMNGIEYGQKAEFEYHQVFQKDGWIYDPMRSGKPIKSTDFMGEYNKMNPGGLNIEIIK